MDFAQLKTVHWTVFYHIHYILNLRLNCILPRWGSNYKLKVQRKYIGFRTVFCAVNVFAVYSRAGKRGM